MTHSNVSADEGPIHTELVKTELTNHLATNVNTEISHLFFLDDLTLIHQSDLIAFHQ